jgi:hypothetical protein
MPQPIERARHMGPRFREDDPGDGVGTNSLLGLAFGSGSGLLRSSAPSARFARGHIEWVVRQAE